MKKCAYCGHENDEALVQCNRCGQELPTEPAASSAKLLKCRGQFRLREPDAKASLGYRDFDTKRLGGTSTITIQGETVLLLQRRIAFKGLLLFLVSFLFLPISLMFIFTSFIFASESTLRLHLIGVVVTAVYFGLVALILKRWRLYRQFPASRIVNVTRNNLPGTAVEFVVLPPEPGELRNEDCSFVTFIPAQSRDIAPLVQLLPQTVVESTSLTRVANPEKKDAADFVQNLKAATPKAWVTPTLIGLNLAVFLVMCFGGADFLSPNGVTLASWGANWGPLTTSGEWWRLLTCCFLHFGVIHLLCNMYALFQAGLLAEKLFGNWFYLAIYLGCGLAGSLTSLCWNPELVSAGASGAVFGVYGAVLGYLLRQRGTVPASIFGSLVQGTGTFIGFNLFYGLTNSKIDQAAHLGGLLSGLLFGLAAARPLEWQRRQEVTGVTQLLLAGCVLMVLVPLFVMAPAFRPKFAQLLNAFGYLCENGANGVAKDVRAAERWYRQAARSGSAEAEFNLGRFYSQGLGGIKNSEEGARWFRQAADHDMQQAEAILGGIYYRGDGVPQDYAEALNWFRKAAEHGVATEQYDLGLMYYKGQGTPPDKAAALEWFRKAADQGVASAEGMLASMYFDGDGTGKNFPEAARWARKAADQGDPAGQYVLGLAYVSGQGVLKDYVEGYAWLSLAASNRAALAPAVDRLQKLMEKEMSAAQLARAKNRLEQLNQTIPKPTHD